MQRFPRGSEKGAIFWSIQKSFFDHYHLAAACRATRKAQLKTFITRTFRKWFSLWVSIMSLWVNRLHGNTRIFDPLSLA